MKTTFNSLKCALRLLLKSHNILIVACLLVVASYILMYGNGSTEQAFNPDIFSPRRIVLAPMFCLGGYLLIVVGILRKNN